MAKFTAQYGDFENVGGASRIVGQFGKSVGQGADVVPPTCSPQCQVRYIRAIFPTEAKLVEGRLHSHLEGNKLAGPLGGAKPQGAGFFRRFKSLSC